MLIRCRQERKNGTEIRLGKTQYSFQPAKNDPDGPHVCEVSNKGHIRRLIMDIPEGYVPHGKKAEKEAEEIFGWNVTDESEDSEEVEFDDAGSPVPKTEMVDDEEMPDDEDVDPDTDDLSVVEDDDVDGNDDANDGDSKDNWNLTADSDEDDWYAWGSQVLGVDVDPKDEKAYKDALENYAKENYGKDLDKRKKPVTMLQEIFMLENN